MDIEFIFFQSQDEDLKASVSIDYLIKAYFQSDLIILQNEHTMVDFDDLFRNVKIANSDKMGVLLRDQHMIL